MNKLLQYIKLEDQNTREEIASFIVGELIGDYDKKYTHQLSNNLSLQRIADLASDLEWSNGSPEELDAMWQEMCSLIKNGVKQ